MMPIYWLVVFFFFLINYGICISIFSEFFLFSMKEKKSMSKDFVKINFLKK